MKLHSTVTDAVAAAARLCGRRHALLVTHVAPRTHWRKGTLRDST
jgi:hypothetical protein